MKLTDLGGLTVESLTLHRMRTLLTLLAVAIGATAVLLLTALGDAAKGYVVGRFAAMGANLVLITPGHTETSGMAAMGTGSDRDLTIEDAEAIRMRVPLTRMCIPISIGSAPVYYEDRHRDVYVLGTTAEYAVMRDLKMARGEFLPRVDPRAGGAEVVIGQTVAHELFGDSDPVGRVVRVSTARFRVIGVMAPKGQSLGFNYDDLVIVPVARGLRLFNQSSLARVLVQAVSSADLTVAAAGAKAVLIDRHRQEDFTLITQDAMLRSFRAVIDALTAALAGIAAISLAVAGIGIMNVMLVSVSERVAEVGLLKALGARRAQILRLFLAEAVVLSAAGAAIGIAIGVAAIEVAARLWPQFPLAPSAGWIATISALALVAGALFGLLPARNASRLEVVEALRGKR